MTKISNARKGGKQACAFKQHGGGGVFLSKTVDATSHANPQINKKGYGSITLSPTYLLRICYNKTGQCTQRPVLFESLVKESRFLSVP